MSTLPFGLRPETGDPAVLDEIVARGGAVRIGLDGVLRRRGRRAWPAWTRGRAAIRGFRWGLRDTFDGSWWPQGVDVAERDGRRVLAVSWFAKPVRGVERGVRVSIVDLRRPRWPRYHHVLLMEPVRDETGRARLEPIVIHAGGIGWSGDALMVADTFGGVRWFRFDDLLEVMPAPFGYAAVLPQSSRWRVEHADAGRRMRFSFLSVEHGDDPKVITGEYRNEGAGDRLVRIGLDGAPLDVHEPGLWRMQGAAVLDGTWFVTTSNGEFTRGDLWAGEPGRMRRHRHALPAGPEDLAVDRVGGVLWSLSEWPGRRRVFQIDPARWR